MTPQSKASMQTSLLKLTLITVDTSRHLSLWTFCTKHSHLQRATILLQAAPYKTDPPPNLQSLARFKVCKIFYRIIYQMTCFRTALYVVITYMQRSGDEGPRFSGLACECSFVPAPHELSSWKSTRDISYTVATRYSSIHPWPPTQRS